jgi:hypothetical protein
MNQTQKFLFLSIAVLFVLACNAVVGTPSAPVPTDQPVQEEAPTPMPTQTPRPQPTNIPTEVPDLAATEQADEFYTLLETFKEKGYLTTTEGEITTLAPFEEEWAQIGWFQWWEYDVTTAAEFLFKARFNWVSATSSPDPSGCGVIFGLQESGDYYSVFLDNRRIFFYMFRKTLYSVGKTSGKGTTSFDNPAESDFVLAVSNKKAYVSVDGDVTVYTLSEDQTTAGNFALSLLSGTNKDYGTRCTATDMVVWSAR